MDTTTMTPRKDVTLDCWDGTYRFALGYHELVTLGEKTEEGPLVTLNRLVHQQWRLADLRETIRLGLIGAGTKQDEALRLVQQNVDRLPWTDSVPIARSILFASLYGITEEGSAETPADV